MEWPELDALVVPADFLSMKTLGGVYLQVVSHFLAGGWSWFQNPDPYPSIGLHFYIMLVFRTEWPELDALVVPADFLSLKTLGGVYLQVVYHFLAGGWSWFQNPDAFQIVCTTFLRNSPFSHVMASTRWEFGTS